MTTLVNLTQPGTQVGMTDPFTQAFHAIGTALLNDAQLSQLLLPGNVRVDGDFVQLSQHQPGDLPRLSLRQGKFLLKPLGGNSLSGAFTQEYELLVLHEPRNIELVNAVKWQLGLALARLGGDLGLSAVRGWRIEGGEDEWPPDPGKAAVGSPGQRSRAAAPSAVGTPPSPASPWRSICRVIVEIYAIRER